MTDNTESKRNGAAAGEVPEVVVERRHGLPLVWLIPVLAGAVALWLAYTTYSKEGPTITITFESAPGVEADKTKIKYRDVALGVVKDVSLSDDLSHVVVTAQIDKSASEQLRENTEFWIENARVTASGVSGLGTLVSGVYIGVKPGGGKPALHFTGREDPPVLHVTVPGTHYTLHADKRGSISANSPIYYRGVQVGEVLGTTLDEAASEVKVFAFVRAPYDKLVRPQTRFWNSGGIDIDLGADGLHVRTESVVTLLVGGITFDTPASTTPSAPSPDDADFPLYASYREIAESGYTQKVRYLVYFRGSVAGLVPGAPVTFHGMQLGTVESVELEVDTSDYSVRVPVFIEIEPQRARVVGANTEQSPHDRMKQFVERGLRAQLRSGSLLTGRLVVALDFFPEEPAAQLREENGSYVIPSVPSTVEQLTQKASAFLGKLADAPVPELVAELSRTVQSVDALLNSTELREGMDGLKQLGPLLQSVKATSDAARSAIDSAGAAVGNDSALRQQLLQLIEQLTEMARSVRTLTDTVERQPNSLIFGKSDSGDH